MDEGNGDDAKMAFDRISFALLLKAFKYGLKDFTIKVNMSLTYKTKYNLSVGVQKKYPLEIRNLFSPTKK